MFRPGEIHSFTNLVHFIWSPVAIASRVGLVGDQYYAYCEYNF